MTRPRLAQTTTGPLEHRSENGPSAARGSAGDLEPALTGALVALERCLTLLESVTSSTRTQDDLAWSLPHLRHCAEHFDCLLEGLAEGLIDYSARRRDARLESDPGLLRRHLETLKSRLGPACRTGADRALTVRDVVAPGQTADLRSGLSRELFYLSSHCIHHLALLERQIGTGAGQVSLGLAFSTEAAASARTIVER